MVARVFPLLLILLSGCAVFQGEAVTKVALLAPFEGRYREVGYDALYAARLAFADSGVQTIDLYPVDDGGSADSAAERAAALTYDPAVAFVLVLGVDATRPEVQEELAPLPTVIIGHWNSTPAGAHVGLLAPKELDAQVDDATLSEVTEAAKAEAPMIGNELLALRQFSLLRDDLDRVTVLSGSTLPDVSFSQRYGQGDPFAPEPGLLATLTYDAARLAIRAVQDEASLAQTRYEGINGVIRFQDGYWQDAPLNEYRYEDGALVPISPQ